MGDYRDHHATIFLASQVARPIEIVRREWDPDMAGCIDAHVTLVYSVEAPLVDLLFERVREACGRVTPFRLRLGGLACFDRPEGGVYVSVEDPDGGYQRMRDEVLRPPFQHLKLSPHVTLIHPRTSRRGREFWDHGHYEPQEPAFAVANVCITAFDGVKWQALETFALGRGPQP